MKKTSKLAKILATGAIALASFGVGNAIAQDVSQAKQPETTIEFNIDYGMQNTSDNSENYTITGVNDLSDKEWSVVNAVASDIGNGYINSYSSLITRLKSLPQTDQENFMIAALNEIYGMNYDSEKMYVEQSQKNFFDILTEDIKSSYYTQDPPGFGVCTGISLAGARALNDLGFESSVISTIDENHVNHAYIVSRAPNGDVVIINGYQKFVSDSKNIEDAIRQYQSQALHSVLLQNSFFGMDGKVKYEVITPEGNQVLNFMNYDPTLNTLEGKILGVEQKEKPDVTVNIGTNENSVKLENPKSSGLIMKGGLIPFSEYNQVAELLRLGWNKSFRIKDFLEIEPKIDINIGSIMDMEKGTYTLPSFDNSAIPRGVIGADVNLYLNTLNKEGLNAGLAYGFNTLQTESNSIFSSSRFGSLYYDQNIQAGLSYTLPEKSVTLKPYVSGLVQIISPDLIKQNKYKPYLKSITAGILAKFKELSLKPYFSWKPWSIGGGMDAKFGNDKGGITFNGGYEKSTYDFAPDKAELSIGTYFNLGKNLDLKMNYKKSADIYSGEPTINDSFTVTGDIKF